ncbi:uncharacterized protein PITG_03531 [Phytophthora infestans T30-4]|uniref:Uncharacterized protein n=1 Tax=Phytophthora infestans (strain T30-4) TaxID=403677 RepID=D0MXU8_PHYIT|nr:uncharacterized protein PITG_03531 [Phytophthora infestans T30-4]EEY65996.1 conserved hypothetical protein [Phytophthora infestans T30-4]|eukprot:XP_002906595.1 conserved hypothetical protein [Phytophthora infestans T30-4]
MLRGKLSRRNQILEVIRRAYYRDVLVIKEELRQNGRKAGHVGSIPKLQRMPSSQESSTSIDGGLSSVPSVDLREVLPLFAPSETVLQLHPCETCGGHLELVHGESKELKAARQEMARVAKGEQQMRAVVQRMRSEAKQMEEVNDALQQRVKALMKENAYTLEQLQAARKTEREQKVIIAGMRSKLQLVQATQDEIDRLTNECKDIKQQLVRSNHDRDIFSASNNHLKEELAQVTRALHVVKVEKAQIESDFGTNYYRLQEEIKKSKQLTEDLAARDAQLKEKMALCAEQQQSLTSLKEELVSTLQRFELTKRHLEDQLIEEERAREEMQEQNLEFRRLNKKLARDLENIQQNRSMDMDYSSMLDDPEEPERPASNNTKKDRSQRQQVASQAMRNNVRKKIDDLQYQVEWASMRENDLAGQLARNPNSTGQMPGLKRASTLNSSEGETRRPFIKPAARAQIESALQEEDELQDALDINDQNFEAYHKEIARMLAEVKQGKDNVAKQQKVITELERKNLGLTDRLEESKLSIDALTGSVNALKMRLNQDSAGAAEMMEALMRQHEEGKREQQYEVEKSFILMTFLRQVSESVHEVSDNKSLILELELDVVPPEDPNEAIRDSEGGIQMIELQRKKREVRRKVLLEKAMKKFGILCHNRAEVVTVEMQKIKASFERMREDLDQAENKIDSDQLHIRTLEAEISKLRLVVDMGKNSSVKMERALKQTTEELNEYTMRCKIQGEEMIALKTEHGQLEDDHQRLTLLLFEKTKAWQQELNANDRCKQIIARLEVDVSELKKECETLQQKLRDIEEQDEIRRQTNRSVEVSAIPETTESEAQTDRWKPQGLILRQRNGPDRMPQRFLGKASVMIHCPELNHAPSPGMDTPVQNQELGALSSLGGNAPQITDTDEHMRGLLELKVYPSIKAGGRQIKTSYASSRPKALSRLYLSSDGVSQKYIAPQGLREGTQQRASFDGRPATVL